MPQNFLKASQPSASASEDVMSITNQPRNRPSTGCARTRHAPAPRREWPTSPAPAAAAWRDLWAARLQHSLRNKRFVWRYVESPGPRHQRVRRVPYDAPCRAGGTAGPAAPHAHLHPDPAGRSVHPAHRDHVAVAKRHRVGVARFALSRRSCRTCTAPTCHVRVALVVHALVMRWRGRGGGHEQRLQGAGR